VRKKINKADELYIKTNSSLSPTELSEAIDLDVMVIKQFLKDSGPKTSMILKSSRLKSGGKKIGAHLSQAAADAPVQERKSLEDLNRPHIYKSKPKD
jgi:hypothetical protein